MLTDAEIRSRYGDLPPHEILLVRAVRDATLEEAAKVAEVHDLFWSREIQREIAEEIRQLKEPANAN